MKLYPSEYEGYWSFDEDKNYILTVEWKENEPRVLRSIRLDSIPGLYDYGSRDNSVD